jgi:DNA modification methylase
MNSRNRVMVGDALQRLRKIEGGSIDMVLTSPPYFRLRDYDVSGQLGIEQSVDTWVDSLRALAHEAHRVLVPTGSFWLNVGDTYSTHLDQGAGRKSLLLGPERLALALIADGWLLRNRIAWAKPNPMPSSVKDRLTASWEYLYVFTKQPQYFFDLDAIRVSQTSRAPKRERVTASVQGREAWRGPNSMSANGLGAMKAEGRVSHPLGKNPSDVWQIATSNYRGAHHATFPIALAARAIAAGAPEARCTRCRLPWKRPLIRQLGGLATRGELTPTCGCESLSEPGLVLDPFFGAGTTAVAAESLGRDWLGIELNPDFAAQAEVRIQRARAGPISNAA